MNDAMEIPAPTATAALESLPNEARIWTYALSRDLTQVEQEQVLGQLERFFANWQSHGRQVRGAGAVLHGRFVIIAATVDSGDISGCGIDASVHVVTPLAERLGIAICGPLDIHYRAASGSLVTVDRLTFKNAAEGGLVDGDTVVYRVDLETLGQLRTQGLECRARESWHARAFDLS